ncbi:MAG: aldehyde dehydrogenase family protein [Actinomycetota bacterium]|nr:aldehyde dehydrogenase family protein [Actinomycetota bacterium]
MEPRLLIDGALRESSDGALLPVINPATGLEVGRVFDAAPEDAEAAIEAARAAMSGSRWAADPRLRAACLGQVHDALQRNADLFRAALVTEVGCPVRMTFADQFQYAVDKLAFYVDVLNSYQFRESLPDLAGPGGNQQRTMWRAPIGVVAAITPWNLPVELMLAKLGGALAGGNALVLKPSPLAAWCGTLLGRIVAEETDIPPGIVSVLCSARVDTAEVLTGSPHVDAIAFTGSTQTGKAVMRSASATVKKVCLELGGKSPSVFLPDADFRTVMPFAAAMALFNSGQSCIMPSRMLVPEDRFEECLELAAAGMAEAQVGDPWSADTFLGPLISSARRDDVIDIVRQSQAQGAYVVCGGNPLPGPGFYMESTLVADRSGTTAASRQEIFGPVVAMTPYRSEAHAEALANDTDFGLAAYVWSGSTERAATFGARIRAGMVGVNGALFTAADMPFGGVGHSGIGREWGIAGMEEFLEIRTMAVSVPS